MKPLYDVAGLNLTLFKNVLSFKLAYLLSMFYAPIKWRNEIVVHNSLLQTPISPINALGTELMLSFIQVPITGHLIYLCLSCNFFPCLQELMWWSGLAFMVANTGRFPMCILKIWHVLLSASLHVPNKLLGYYWHVPSVSTNNFFDILMFAQQISLKKRLSQEAKYL